MRDYFINLIRVVGSLVILSLHDAFRSEHRYILQCNISFLQPILIKLCQFADELLLYMSIYLRPMSIFEMVVLDVVEHKENVQIDLPLQSIERFEKF